MLDAEFLSQVQEITAACTHENVQKAVFSATLPANAEKVAMAMLRDPIRIVVGLKSVDLFSDHILSVLIFISHCQGHSSPSYRPISNICRGRPIKASQSSHLPRAPVQPTRSHIHFHTTPCILISRGTRHERNPECRLPARGDE